MAGHSARLRVHCDDIETARALSVALRTEADDPLPKADVVVGEPVAGTEATHSELGRSDGPSFLIEVRADELAYLRAAINSYLKWARAASDALDSAA